MELRIPATGAVTVRQAVRRQPCLVALVAAAGLLLSTAGCGGSHAGPHLGGSDVAVVGSIHIEKPAYEARLAHARARIAGRITMTAASSTLLADAVMTSLVSAAEQRDAASRRGTTTTAALAAVERRARVTAADRASFVGFLGNDVRVAREIRYIVLADQARARRLFIRLSTGDDGTWCALARYSLDHGSRDRCGTSLVTAGMLVQPLDRTAFTAPEGATSLLTDANGYWTILEPLSNVDRTGSPFEINQMLLIQRKTILVGRYETTLARRYCTGVNVSYRHGFRPQQDPTRCDPARERRVRERARVGG